MVTISRQFYFFRALVQKETALEEYSCPAPCVDNVNDRVDRGKGTGRLVFVIFL